MKAHISFCPLCAGKLDAGDDNQFSCDDCESTFFIQIVEEGDDDDDEDEDDDDDDEDEEEIEEKDEY